ncbi:MAG: HAMP domain-containing histidine kinase [Chloroflexi bacterium]|nr:HAMP domain-containing histidine kinase [Chloroflexota bacterium]
MTAIFGGLRWRMVGWSILVLGVVLLVIGVVLYLSLSRTLMVTLDAQLESASQSARMELLESGGTVDLQRDGYRAGVLYVVLAPDGSVVANPQQLDVQVLPAQLLTSEAPTFVTTTISGDAVRLYAQPVIEPNGDHLTLIVGQSLAPEYAAAQQLMLTLGVCGALGLLFSFAGAWFLAARALVPINRAFQRQQEFVADASHELRTPLTILHSAADLLASDPRQPSPGLVYEIREEISRMERLTRDLLTLARSDRGELTLALGRLELGALARDLAQRVSVLAEARSIRLEVHSPEAAVLIEGDPDRLQQVGLAVLDNALNHTPPGGTITITVYQRTAAGFLVIEDTGEGIPEDHLARVFDRFHRVDPSRARSTGGAGLGLAIARMLVEAHGGSIEIASGRESGTRVTICVPLVGTDPEPAQEPDQGIPSSR